MGVEKFSIVTRCPQGQLQPHARILGFFRKMTGPHDERWSSPAHCGHHAALQLGTVFTHSMRPRLGRNGQADFLASIADGRGARSGVQANGSRPESVVTQRMAESKAWPDEAFSRNGVAIRFSTGPDAGPALSVRARNCNFWRCTLPAKNGQFRTNFWPLGKCICARNRYLAKETTRKIERWALTCPQRRSCPFKSNNLAFQKPLDLSHRGTRCRNTSPSS